MPRKKLVEKKPLAPDPRYKSVLVTKFTNCLMLDGKKSLASKDPTPFTEDKLTPSGSFRQVLSAPACLMTGD